MLTLSSSLIYPRRKSVLQFPRCMKNNLHGRKERRGAIETAELYAARKTNSRSSSWRIWTSGLDNFYEPIIERGSRGKASRKIIKDTGVGGAAARNCFCSFHHCCSPSTNCLPANNANTGLLYLTTAARSVRRVCKQAKPQIPHECVP